MSKRYTDTEKWARPWFRELSESFKLLWCYILDHCDVAGVWYVDLKLANIHMGTRISLDRALVNLSKQIEVLGDGRRWFIVDFIRYQYGLPLSRNSRVHAAVLRTLEGHGIPTEKLSSPHRDPIVTPSSGVVPVENASVSEEKVQTLGYPIDRVKDKDKDKDLSTEELFSTLVSEKKVFAPVKQNATAPSLDKRDGGPNVHIRPLIDLFHTKLTTKLGEKPASFNGGAAAAGFKRLLTSYDLGLISGRFENWFLSTDRHIEKRGWRIEDFFTYFNRLKDGPVSVYVPEKEKVKSNGVPSVEATKKMLSDLWKQ